MREELLKGCNGTEEILKLVKEEGIELTDDQLEAVSGGNCFTDFDCPKCGGNIDGDSCDMYYNYVCPHCDYAFKRQEL